MLFKLMAIRISLIFALLLLFTLSDSFECIAIEIFKDKEDVEDGVC